MGAFLWPSGERGSDSPQPCPAWASRAGRGGEGVRGGGPYLEVRAVVVVPVHNLLLAAIPGQHRDHLPARQVCVELRGEDVDSGRRQSLRGWGGSGPGHVVVRTPRATERPCEFTSLDRLHRPGPSFSRIGETPHQKTQ